MAGAPVALLGTGKMGAAFVDRWHAADRPVVLWNRTPETARALVRDGVTAVDSLDEALSSAEVVVTSLTHGEALQAVLLEQGVIDSLAPGRVVVDLSTVDVDSSQAVADRAQERGVLYLRGAVSGSPSVVRSGAASLLLSGSPDAYQAAEPVLADLVDDLVMLGTGEEARVVKIAVNSMLAGTMQLLAEAVAMVEASGVDREVFLDALDSTVMSSRFVSYKGAALRARDYRATFTTNDMRKDASLAVSLAQSRGVVLPVGSAVLAQIEEAISAGYGADDFLSLLCVEQLASGQEPDLAHPDDA